MYVDHCGVTVNYERHKHVLYREHVYLCSDLCMIFQIMKCNLTIFLVTRIFLPCFIGLRFRENAILDFLIVSFAEKLECILWEKRALTREPQ